MSYCVLRFVSESKCGQLVGWVQKDIAHLRSQRSSRAKRGSRRHGRYQGSLDRATFISCRIFGVDYSSCLHFAKEICSPGGGVTWYRVRSVCVSFRTYFTNVTILHLWGAPQVSQTLVDELVGVKLACP